ncbi:MAG: hypothetical protein IKR25_07555 [Muribaculaceae bacterium]|nr:hypothetical protein [Muribaculaceae bacterium]
MAASDQITIPLTFSTDSVIVSNIAQNDSVWSYVSYNGMPSLGSDGAPMLPCKYLTLSVPYNARNISVSVSASCHTDIALNHSVYPSQPCKAISDTTASAFCMDTLIYASSVMYPSLIADKVSEGYYLGENRVLSIAIHPVLYNPKTKTIRINEQFDVIISYDLVNMNPNSLLYPQSSSLRSEFWENTRSCVANPEVVENNAYNPPRLHRFNPDDTCITDSVIDPNPQIMFHFPEDEYIVVVPDSLKKSVTKLVALKRQKGYKTGLVTVESILSNPVVEDGDVILNDSGNVISALNDDAGKIRQYLKGAFKAGTRFVLFVGKDVPFRYGYTSSADSALLSPSDLYYSELNSDWSSFSTDAIDFQPELYVGRLPAVDGDEIDSYIDKLLLYELNPGKGDTDYLTRCFFTQCAQLQKNDEAHYVYNYLNSTFPDWTLMEEITATNPKGRDVISNMHYNPSGFYSLHGHGNSRHITVNHIRTMPDNHRPYTITADEDGGGYGYDTSGCGIDLVGNGTKPGVMYSIACTTMPFDDYRENGGVGIWSMGESYVFGKDYGGIAYLGNTRSGYYSTNYSGTNSNCSASLEAAFCNLVKNKTFYKIGQLEAESKTIPNAVNDDFSRPYPPRCRIRHNLLGDPEVELWTAQPQVIGNGIEVVRNNSSVIVTGIGGTGSSIVGICANGGFCRKDTTSTGSVTFNSVPSNCTVMVYQHDALPYVAPLVLQNTNISKSQYVIASDVLAGSNVDSNRTAGDVTIKSGVEYEIEYKGEITFGPGFAVDKGATFTVTPSDYR